MRKNNSRPRHGISFILLEVNDFFWSARPIYKSATARYQIWIEWKFHATLQGLPATRPPPPPNRGEVRYEWVATERRLWDEGRGIRSRLLFPKLPSAILWRTVGTNLYFFPYVTVAKVNHPAFLVVCHLSMFPLITSLCQNLKTV
jgi:hypothetical protein